MSPTLDRSPLLLEFKRILAEEASGTLTVAGEGCTRKLVFSGGMLADVESTRPQEGLTTILQDCGLISGDVLEENDERFAELLINRGVLQRGEVDFARLHRMRIIAFSLFSLAQGQWTFRAHAPLSKSGGIYLADILSDVVSSVKTHYYFREIFSRSHPRFVSIPVQVLSRVYERQSSLFSRMQRLNARSHDQIRAKLGIEEQDYWETLILFFLLGGVVFSGPDTSDAVKKRREMIIRWRDCLESGQLDPHDLLGISAGAAPAEIENAFRKRVRDFHPQQLELDPGSELYDDAVQIVEQMEAARNTLTSSATSSPPGPAQKVETVNPVKQAQVYFQEALEHKARKSYVEAADCLDRAIRLDSERAKYFFQLGLCQMHLPAFRKNAEQNLLKAAEMEPWNAEPAYHLGMMFRSAGLRRMSEKYFRKALEINMDHTKAGQALQELSGSPSRRPRKGKGSFF
ncbi:MAG TPA: hypothetical protein ENN40_09205 [Candidatus Aminicenantes bacterium]|mgnify:CR=1 FL=1|nr:hypothetical protein [Candidatus Aminicenantes bacterium]